MFSGKTVRAVSAGDNARNIAWGIVGWGPGIWNFRQHAPETAQHAPVCGVQKTHGLDSRCTVSGAFSQIPLPRRPQTMSMLADTSVNTIRFQWPRFPFHKQSPQLRNQVYTPKRRTDKIFWLKPFLVFVCCRARRYVQCRQETMQGTLRGALLVGGQAFGISGSMPQKRRSMPQCAGSKKPTD